MPLGVAQERMRTRNVPAFDVIRGSMLLGVA
jgi:hypothetical protein